MKERETAISLSDTAPVVEKEKKEVGVLCLALILNQRIF